MTSVDVAIIGAGAAGISAARRLVEAGRSVAVLEARTHVGGRAVTRMVHGHAIDLGAHWLHSGEDNPLIWHGWDTGEKLRLAPDDVYVYVGGRLSTARESRAAGKCWGDFNNAIVRAARGREDRPASAAIFPMGPWRERTNYVLGLVCGRPLNEVSAKDYAQAKEEDDHNYFIAGGYGAYVARLAKELPVHLGVSVTAVDWSGTGVTLGTSAGTLHAASVIITVPVMVLQQGDLRFTPALPEATERAINGFLSATYEHVLMHWPSAPFRDPDRLCAFGGGRNDHIAILSRIDGTAFHYFEIDHPTAMQMEGRGRDVSARYARDCMRERFGAAAIRDLTTPVVTKWRHDPLALGSWSVVPPGFYGIRRALQAPVADRLWFAGEATAPRQWGTVGGAWLEGQRAAREILRKVP